MQATHTPDTRDGHIVISCPIAVWDLEGKLGEAVGEARFVNNSADHEVVEAEKFGELSHSMSQSRMVRAADERSTEELMLCSKFD